MIFLIAHIDEAHRVGGDAPRIVELSIGGSLASECSQESSWDGNKAISIGINQKVSNITIYLPDRKLECDDCTDRR